MKYLLDVNALVALGLLDHVLHDRVATWVRGLGISAGAQLLTSPITELGMVRVVAQAPQYGFTVAQARTLLTRLKRSEAVSFGFIADDHDASHLPSWAKSAKQTTDGHLAQLAIANDAVLATLDERIPGAFVIPF
jgi:predicted nucleic acid-binding protein